MSDFNKCHCRNVGIGEFTNQACMEFPFDYNSRIYSRKRGDIVCIDTCIATEIGYLWRHGVLTINSCCGHQRYSSTVIVAKTSEKKMDDLGYKSFINKCGVKCYQLETGTNGKENGDA